MEKMRKVLCIVLAVLMSIPFCSCSSSENNIETYHGLTTSKPLQLRCFQSS